ncbi:hypothetical protein N8I77_000379 [Diaporthe amygdali]|uniref:Alginate lyase domain-containing protein n=1 Tax=Phomopsis amygdali TaxID=1214568 RepID=A0AAD9SNP4_PHOAM|nr:hypothetical protein N8I77_000379 [Diaporthe amygdali]
MPLKSLLAIVLISWSTVTNASPTDRDELRYRVAKPLVHPGALHTIKDIERVREHVQAEEQPWYRAWQHLESTKLAQITWAPTPQEIIVRGTNTTLGLPENYGYAYRDAHSAYQLTLRWLIGGSVSYADHAVEILDGWSSTLVDIKGSPDKYLAAGLYGYQFANAAELLRKYHGWPNTNQEAFGGMLNDIFAVYNRDFLDHHNNQPDFYYANRDLCNIASLMAIGIFNDNKTMYDYAVKYFKDGLPGQPEVVANGTLPYFSVANFTEDGTNKTLMQMQESGRDQAHSLLCISLLGVIGQQGWNQGVDLYSTYGHQVLNAITQTTLYHTLPTAAGKACWKLSLRKPALTSGLGTRQYIPTSLRSRVLTPWALEYRNFVNGNLTENIEGGGGDYSPNSGGYDSLGHGTLLYRLVEED